MAEENQLEVKIVLDDGSIQSGFIKIEQAAAKSGEKIEKSFGQKLKESVSNIESPTDILAGLVLVKEGFEAVRKVAEKAIDLALLGESVKAVDRQFENLANTAGLSGEAIKTGLEKASRGLIDNSDLTKLANEGIVKLGLNAEKLPELFALADKAAVAFGGSSAQAFDKITTAIASGNLRSLRDFGLKIDLSKQFEKFEKDNQIAAGTINEFQKQQIALNAVLKESETRFAGISTSLTPVADSIKRTENAFHDLKESVGTVANKAFGPAISATTNFFADLAKSASINLNAGFGSPIDEAVARVSKLESSIEKVKELQSAGIKSFSPTGVITETVRVSDELARLNAELKETKERVEQLRGPSPKQFDPREASAANEARAKVILDLQKQQDEEFKKRDAFNKTQQLKSEEQHIKSVADLQKVNATEYDTQQINLNEARLLAENKYAQESLKIQTDLNVSKTINAQQAATLMAQAKQAEVDALAVLNQKELENEQSRNIGIIDSFNSFAKGFDDMAKFTSESAKKNFQDLGGAVFKTFSTGVGNAFANVGKAIAKGENALEAFGSSLLQTMGQVAIQMGTQFILTGAAALIWPEGALALGISNPAGLIAAGAALAAFGGFISASGGGASAPSSAGGGSSAGATSTGGGTDIGAAQIANSEKNQVGAKVDINIQGNVLNNRDSALYIADILNEQFKSGGVIFGAT